MLWNEAVRHACWLKNHTSTRALGGKTPYEVRFGRKPNLAHLPEWGTKIFVHHKPKSKLALRARVGYWVGFGEDEGALDQSQGHRVYWKDTKAVTMERSVTFSPAELRSEGEG
ncbi:hypothetical protein K523DRAFT_191916, partial [Schizophyllum commune Tattone D]